MSKKFSKEEALARIDASKPGYELVGEYVDIRTPTLFLHKDCGYEWMVSPDNLYRRSGCPRCSKKRSAGMRRKTRDGFISELSSRRPEYELIGSYINIDTATTFLHKNCGNVWMASPTNILNGGRGCPHCAERGFNAGKPGYFYILKFIVNGHGFLKFGITNKPLQRYTTHRRQGMQEVLLEKHFEFGSGAKLLEDLVKHKFGGNHVTKEVLPDGYTETLPLHLLEEVRALLV